MKVLVAGDRSSQVGCAHSEGLAWILQTTVSKEWRMQGENALLSLRYVCDKAHGGRDGQKGR